jgi:uncharacterized membrane protein
LANLELETTQNITRSIEFDKWLWWASLVTAFVGLLDSIYLTYIKIGGSTPALCQPGGGCDVVNNSPYAELFGIPIALLGAGAYLFFLGALVVENRRPAWREASVLIQFGIALVGVLYSAYLTYLELAVIHAICPYCVVSAICLVILFGIALFRLVKYPTSEDTPD